jgi:hypothetical protein
MACPSGRDGASRKTLRAIVDCAIAAWDTLVTQHANKQRMRQPQRSGRLQSHKFLSHNRLNGLNTFSPGRWKSRSLPVAIVKL